MTPTQDQWAQWLLHRRHGGDPAQMQAVLDFLYPVRDRVLANAGLKPGDTLLDVGCGDGLIAFGALQQTPDCRVIFSDISPDLLTHVETLARELGVRERCRFLRASADDLKSLADSSLDAITTRSVLIYVSNKRRALAEFRRVLGPGGRLSMFEPINRLMVRHEPGRWAGYDVTPVMDLTAKLRAVYERLRPSDGDPMLDFDERELLALVEEAGFRKIELELQMKVGPAEQPISWDVFIKSSPNPLVPAFEDVLREALDLDERERFISHLRPLVESGQSLQRSALMYLWAVK